MSDLLVEEVVASLAPNGAFTIDHHFESGVPTLAVWIACDGDDTDSTFSVTIHELILE